MAVISGLFRLGRDAEARYAPSGDAVVNLSLAFNYGKRADGLTQWVEASLWGKLAESLAPYLKKGGLIDAIIEDPHIETYQGKNGEGVKLTGRVLKIELAGSKGDNAAAVPTTSTSQHDRDKSNGLQQQRPASGGGNFDDDIPFAQIGRGMAAYTI